MPNSEDIKLTEGFDGYYSNLFTVTKPLTFEYWLSKWEGESIISRYFLSDGVTEVNLDNVDDITPLKVMIRLDGDIPKHNRSINGDTDIFNDNFLKELSLFLYPETDAIFTFQKVTNGVVRILLYHLVNSTGFIHEITASGSDENNKFFELLTDQITKDKPKAKISEEELKTHYSKVIGPYTICKYLTGAFLWFSDCRLLRDFCLEKGMVSWFTKTKMETDEESLEYQLYFPDPEDVFEFITMVRKYIPYWTPHFHGGVILITLPLSAFKDMLAAPESEHLSNFLLMHFVINNIPVMTVREVSVYLDLSRFSKLTSDGMFYKVETVIHPEILKAIGRTVVETPVGTFIAARPEPND